MRAMALGCVALVVGLVGLARAADTITLKPDDIIAARQAGFDLQAGVATEMKAVVDSGGDVKPLTDGAKGLSHWGRIIPTMFPAGTENGHNTKAKPEIWSNTAGFQKAAENYTQAADKLAVLAEAGDKAGFAAQFKETAAACGACHRQFKSR